MPTDEGLRQQQAIYKNKYDQLLKKIAHLEQDVVNAAGGAQKFQFQQELEQARAELNRTDWLVKDLQETRLYHALLAMDYDNQTESFDQYTQRIGAFLIHAPADYGHNWLLQCLLRRLPTEPEVESVVLHLGSPNFPKEVAALWYQLAERLQLRPFPPPAPTTVAQRTVEWLKTKTVVLLLLGLDAWEEQQALALIEQFWKQLVKAAQETLNTDTLSRLLMFIVDYCDRVRQWHIPAIDAPSQQVEPSLPIRLQQITPFTQEIVQFWVQFVNRQSRELVQPLLMDLPQTVQAILQDSHGLPDQVAMQICHRCGHYYQKGKWLQLWSANS